MRLLLFHRRTAGTQDGPSVPELVLCEAAPAPRAQPGAVGSARAPPGGRGLRAGTESGSGACPWGGNRSRQSCGRGLGSPEAGEGERGSRIQADGATERASGEGATWLHSRTLPLKLAVREHEGGAATARPRRPGSPPERLPDAGERPRAQQRSRAPRQLRRD